MALLIYIKFMKLTLDPYITMDFCQLSDAFWKFSERIPYSIRISFQNWYLTLGHLVLQFTYNSQ